MDLDPLLAAARDRADTLILFSDRPRPGAKLALFGAPGGQLGIVEFNATDEEVFIRLVNHGPPRPIPVELRAGELRPRGPARGPRGLVRSGDYSRATAEVSLGASDSFPADDAVEATRLGRSRLRVTLAGRTLGKLVEAFRAFPE